MINYLYNFIIKSILFNFYYFYHKKKFVFSSSHYNFEKISFENKKKNKKIFFSSPDEILDNSVKNDYYTFCFLKTGLKLGGENNIKIIKQHLISWNNLKISYLSIYWNLEYACERLINLMYVFEFISNSLNTNELNLINKIVIKHVLFIKFVYFKLNKNNLNIFNYKVLLLASFSNYFDFKNKLVLLKNILSKEIDLNGFHKSYNPLKQAIIINYILEIKDMLLAQNIEIPDEIEITLIKMQSILKSLIHIDGSLALYNGSNNFFNLEISKLLKSSKDIKAKTFLNQNYGIGFYNDNKKKFFMDLVHPQKSQTQKNLHASTLAIEFSYDKEKIITNCGSADVFNENKKFLRYSAAHSTIVLQNTNISEISENKYHKRFPKNIIYDHQNKKNEIIIQGSHDGYKNNFHKIIKRKVIINKNEPLILGEDSIIPTKFLRKNIVFQIRFHLMPNLLSTLTNDMKKVIIRTQNNQKWIFESISQLSIEDSIYVDLQSSIIQNKQIVISGLINDKKIVQKWSLKKYE